MAIDLRAVTTCNLGPLISASISDDYIQGNGLIKIKGSCELAGIYTPPAGTEVTFSYTKSGVTRNVPRRLRVLSSFADPFQRVTQIQLGCKLTYLENLKPRLPTNVYDDPENEGLDPLEPPLVSPPIYGSSVMVKCLAALGIVATNVPLTSRFAVQEFDLSSGYVNVLSDLLVSESYCGYLDYNEILQVFFLGQSGGTGALLNSSDLISIGPIGVGGSPAERVTVKYESLELEPEDGTQITEPTEEEEAPDSFLELTSGGQRFSDNIKEDPAVNNDESAWYQPDITLTSSSDSIIVPYSDADGNYSEQFYPGLSISESITTYELKRIQLTDDQGRYTEEQLKNFQTFRITTELRSSASVMSSLYSELLSRGGNPGNYQVFTQSLEEFSYDNFGNESSRKLTKTASGEHIIGALGIDLIYDNPDNPDVFSVVTIPPQVLDEIIEVYNFSGTDIFGAYTSSITLRYVPYYKTLAGQQATSRAREFIGNVTDANSHIGAMTSGVYLLDRTVEFSRSARTPENRPTTPEQTVGFFASSSGDPYNNYKTSDTADLEVDTGSPDDATSLELELPYAPDDVFVPEEGSNATSGRYFVSKGYANLVASRFARVQNRLLFGNQRGMNIQIAPEKLPAAPFSPIFIEAAGAIALYRLNAASWTIDSNGLVCSSDAIFWGTAGAVV